MDSIRFGSDGWRARYDEDFTPANVARVSDAVARTFAEMGPGKTVLVGYDTRLEGRAFAELAAEVMAAHGLTVMVADGCCPTSALCWNVSRDPDAVGGLMLTASHNGADYNGIKVRLADGGSAPKDVTDHIESTIAPSEPQARGRFGTFDVMGDYLEALPKLVDAKAIRSAGLTVVHDALFGSTRSCASALLEGLGVRPIPIHAEEREDFAGLQPDPIEPWLEDCRAAVSQTGASMGLVNDGDGDRIGVIDEGGRTLTSHTVIALLLQHLVENRGMRGRVVATTSCSAIVRRQAQRLEVPLTVAPVGFSWVYNEMLKGDVLLGGEEYGGIGFPFHLLERDGLFSDLLMCELLARSGKPLSGLVTELEEKVGHMDYGRRDLSLDRLTLHMLHTMLPGINPKRVAGMKPVEVSHADGLRLVFEDDAWLLVRLSETEQLVRVYAEAPDLLERDALLEAGCEIARCDG